MTEEGRERLEKLNRTVNDRELSKKLAVVGWGLFLIWIGIVKMTAIGSAGGLLGVGAIILGIQGARSLLSLPYEGIWVVAGLIFSAGGIWNLLQADLRIMPLLLIVAGLGLIASVFRRGLSRGEEPDVDVHD